MAVKRLADEASSELFPLELRGLSKKFGSVRALSDVSLRIEAGECIALLGENGAGKSTLMKLLAGVEQPTAGGFCAAGRELTISNARAASAAGIHLCHQELQFVPGMTVLENLQLGQEQTKWALLRDDRLRLDEAVDSLRSLGFDKDLRTKMGTLSVADRQLISVAKGLRSDVRLVILDEPTAALAPREAGKVAEMVRRLTSAGRSVIYISHRLDEIQSVADRIFVLRDGRLVGEAPPTTQQDQIIRMMVGRDIVDLYPHTRRDPGAEVLRISGLSATGIEDVSLTVHAGEVVGIGGLVGSGQTALARTLYGVNPPTAGRIMLNGSEYRPRSVAHALSSGIGYLGEDRRGEGMVFGQPIFDNIALPAIRGATPRGFVRSRALRAKVEDLAARTRIKTPSLAQPMSSLSGGNQQKAVLARTLITGPKLVLLLEPTRGVDVGARADIYELLDELTAQGKAILLITSDMPELMGLSDRIVVMYRGKLTGELTADGITADRLGELATGTSGV